MAPSCHHCHDDRSWHKASDARNHDDVHFWRVKPTSRAPSCDVSFDPYRTKKTSVVILARPPECNRSEQAACGHDQERVEPTGGGLHPPAHIECYSGGP